MAKRRRAMKGKTVLAASGLEPDSVAKGGNTTRALRRHAPGLRSYNGDIFYAIDIEPTFTHEG
jgi:hypothetical protein